MSEQPPPFQLPDQPQAAKGKSSKTLWIIAACVLIPCCVCVVGGGFWGFKIFNEMKPMVGCFAAADRIGQALQQYAADHNGKFPTAEKWQDELLPYYQKSSKSEEAEIFGEMKTDGPWGCWDASGKPISGFVFNKAFSAKKPSEVKGTDPVIFETVEIKKNNVQAYTLRDPSNSPKIIFGERRGWIEIDSAGRVTMLMREGGEYERTPVNMRGSGFNIESGTGVKVEQTPAKNEPGK